MNEDGLVWTLDTVHFPAPITRWTAYLFTELQTELIRRIAAELGSLLDGIAFREVDGRVYFAPVPLGGRNRTPPPPRLVPILCRVVPSLRRRLATARRAEEEDVPGTVVHEWLEEREDDLLDRGRALLRVDVGALDDGALAAHLDRHLALAEEGLGWHFRLHAAAVAVLGALGRELTEEHGWSITDVLALFTGLSDTTTGPAVAQRAIVDLVREAGALHVLEVAADLDAVAALSPGVAAALGSYLELWGQRAVRYELAYPTVAERPEWLLRRLQDEARGGGDPAVVAERHAHQRAVAEAHLFATLGDTPDVRHRLARARRVFPVREGNETATIGVPLAGLRRVGLEVGRRLRLEHAEDVFDLTIPEVRAALRPVPGAVPDPSSLAARRRREREALAAIEPRATIGRPSAQPVGVAALEGFPADAVRRVADTLWYADQVVGRPEPVVGAAVVGLGVSPGVVEGIARVVLDEDGFDRLRPGDVLVCPTTSPVWSMVFPSLSGLVCDGGGGMSHPAIIAREFGIPAVVGTATATQRVPDGCRVRVDGDAGTVTVLDA